jgi:hypothetical protein
MKPFDLEAAKRGEPIAAKIDGVWCSDVKFVGTGYHDNVIVDTPQYGTLRIGSVANLRMVPKKRTVYVNIYTSKAGESNAWHHDNEEIARSRARTTGRIALAIAVPVEIEE